MEALRLNSLSKNKINVRPVGNRSSEATAEDFRDLGLVTDNHADMLNQLTGGIDQNPNYGIFTSLMLLTAAYPTGEPNAYAIIDSGLGSRPYIAYWNETTQRWDLEVTVLQIQNLIPITQGMYVANHRVTDDNGDDHIIVGGVLEGTNPLRFEDYSANSISIAL